MLFYLQVVVVLTTQRKLQGLQKSIITHNFWAHHQMVLVVLPLEKYA